MFVNSRKYQVWQKQKLLLDERANIVSGKESEYQDLENLYKKLLSEAVKLGEDIQSEKELVSIFS